jgi:hypothetical protein
MRRRLVTIVFVLALSHGASAQQPGFSLPSAPASPRDPAQCSAYRAKLDGQLAEIGREHEACLDSYKADRQGDNNMVCSRSECQSLHTLLYGSSKDQDDQRVASCEAAVQRYQARERAQQQGIETLGNALADALSSSPSTPIDSQSALATYEEQQKGQAVLGDGSDAISSTDSAAVAVMNSGVPEASSSAQTELDSAVDATLMSSTPGTPTGSETQAIPGHPYMKLCWYGPCPNRDALTPDEQRQLEIVDALDENGFGSGPSETNPFTLVQPLLDSTNDYLNSHVTAPSVSRTTRPPVPPVPLPQPTPPNQATIGPQGSNNLPAPQPAPAPTPTRSPSPNSPNDSDINLTPR